MKSKINLLCLLLLTALLSGCGVKSAEFGNWTTRLPEDRNYFYAVGGPAVGPPEQARPAANLSARAEMSTFVQSTVDAEIERYIKETNHTLDDQVIERTRIQSKETLRYVSIVEVRKSPEGYYALARMPRRPLDEILDEIKFVKVPPSLGEVARSAVIPGWGQFHKGQTQKGIALLGSEAALIGGSFILLSLRDDAAEKSLYARTTGARASYRERKENYEKFVLGTLIGAGAVYIYNLVDVTTVPKKVEASRVSVSWDANQGAVVLQYRKRSSRSLGTDPLYPIGSPPERDNRWYQDIPHILKRGAYHLLPVLHGENPENLSHTLGKTTYSV